MKIFNGIIGVLSLFGMIYCIFWPDATFLNVGWIVALILFLWGICSIITSTIDKKQGHKDSENAAYGTAGLVISIILCILSIISLIIPEVSGVLLLIVLLAFMLFLIIAGVRNIIFAVKAKKLFRKKDRVVKLILGIAQLLLAILGLVGWFVDENIANIFIGIMLGVFGCTLIASIFVRDKIDRYKNL